MKTYRYLLVTGVLLLSPNAAYAVLGDLSNWLYNVAIQIPDLMKLLVAIGYVSGFGFIIGGIMKLKSCAQGISQMSKQESVGPPLLHIMIGTVLVYFAGIAQVGSVTFFGDASLIAYQTSASGSAAFSGALGPVIMILRFIGYISFMRGFFILAKLGHQAQQGTLAKGVVHIIGGIMAINIEATYIVLLNTLMGTNGSINI